MGCSDSLTQEHITLYEQRRTQMTAQNQKISNQKRKGADLSSTVTKKMKEKVPPHEIPGPTGSRSSSYHTSDGGCVNCSGVDQRVKVTNNFLSEEELSEFQAMIPGVKESSEGQGISAANQWHLEGKDYCFM